MGECDTLEKVRKFVSEFNGIEMKEIHNDSHFIKDLEFESIDMYEMLFELEEKFNVSITQDQAGKLLTIKDVVEYIELNKAG